MPQPPSSQFLVGQRPKHRHINRISKFFFTQLDRGFESPYVLLASGTLFSYLAWRITDFYVRPHQEQLALKRPIQRVPFEASHNAFWGFGGSQPSMTASHAMSDSENVAEVGSSLFIPQMVDGWHEEAMRRPQLLFSEVSELSEPSSPVNPTGEVDLVCLELSEYDANLRDDVYYRSVHYVPVVGGALSLPHDEAAHRATKETWKRAKERGSEWTPMRSPGEGAAASAGRNAAAAGASTTKAAAAEVGAPPPASDYLEFMPGQGSEVIHGTVKCKGITTQNNCVPFPGHLEEEYARKMMLTLGPVHILRDAAKTLLPLRFSFAKQTPVETLVLGLHSGGLPRWLSTCYPNFNVHVVEKDGALVRLCKRFLGFTETSNLSVHVTDPVEYVRHRAVVATHVNRGGGRSASNTDNGASKLFDLVLIDGMDGAGRLSTQYGRLDFIRGVRGVMSNNGCVAVALPNKDAGFVFNMVQNWRMGFAGRPVLLIHCVTSPCTIMMTFQDCAERGKANIGTIAKMEEFQDILREHVHHYGADRMQFDITKEVSATNFSVLHPERSYELEAYLPLGHPAVLAAKHKQIQEAILQTKRSRGWSAWLRRLTGTGLSPGQRADLNTK